MKRALVRCDGFITDLVAAGEEFEVYTGPGSGLRWIDIPDEATNLWKLELGSWIPDFEYTDPELKRIVDYGGPGEQLGMLYKDVEAGLFGEAAKNGEWFKHIKHVKETDDPVEYDDDGNKILPDEPFPHDETMPAWNTPEEMDIGVRREFQLAEFADREIVPTEEFTTPGVVIPVTDPVDTNPDA